MGVDSGISEEREEKQCNATGGGHGACENLIDIGSRHGVGGVAERGICNYTRTNMVGA